MSVESNDGVTTIKQSEVIIPDLTIKDLLSAIPAHCFKRSAIRSSLYVAWDCIVIGSIYKAATFLDALITPEVIHLPHPIFYPVARFSVWSLYGFLVGLFGMGLWVIAHECGHQAFSESKFINNTVGWVLHSALGVPYHSWRISHAKHHASTGHMTQDQAFVPKTRSQLGLPAFDPTQESILGLSVSAKVKKELQDALGDSPIGAALGAAGYLLWGFPAYLICNASGQKQYPKGTNHFNPNAIIFAPHQYDSVIVSDIGILLWLAGLAGSIHKFGFWDVFRVYIVPYLWVNHWLVLITFLQHTDPILPHYRAAEFTFPRGALSTLDRSLLGDCGKIMAWIGAHATHGISETHVLHHVSSKIPHYNAWEASDALRQRLKQAEIVLQGAPGGWREVYRVYRACRFVEDEGNITFYKNALGLAASRAKIVDDAASDSGVEVDTI
ncbi:fatty acid desaturase-domain-containing protein [Boletus edulis]|uniref:Fatty acid desaturase-domain-containing protein n=1 Tax=Boletus edulis BED1 TaxID=1328754 RepID=A0AAD4BW53_BOLED|nr:fatty acid desaturase-domain-containing protein [Boletus edulis]KAF8440812.1 fatty acid desaturase-domain-containing protein [Boletus edulis BED1]